jgi:hypothetical protein
MFVCLFGLFRASAAEPNAPAGFPEGSKKIKHGPFLQKIERKHR